jgi:hypothetical protein
MMFETSSLKKYRSPKTCLFEVFPILIMIRKTIAMKKSTAVKIEKPFLALVDARRSAFDIVEPLLILLSTDMPDGLGDRGVRGGCAPGIVLLLGAPRSRTADTAL